MNNSDEKHWVKYDKLIRYSSSGRAALFKFGDLEVWIPISQILDRDLEENVMCLPFWLIKKKEIESYID